MNSPGPLPLPDLDWDVLRPHWDAARRQEFRMPRCTSCMTFNWYPKETCRACGASSFEWVLLQGRASLFTWVVVHRALHPSLAPLQPYVSAIVAIEEDPRVRYVTRILDAPSDALRIGAGLQVCYEDFGHPVQTTGATGVFFRLSESSESRGSS
jgi:uncharacterized protein